MVRNSHAVSCWAGWSLALLVGLTGSAGCGSNKPTAPRTDPVLQPLVGTWEIDCGNGFVQFKLEIGADHSGNFNWQTYMAPGSTHTKINRMDLRLASTAGGVEGTVVRADDLLYNGRKMRISTKDADSIVVHGDAGDEAVVDMDYTLYRESSEHQVECGGD
jgi:hypothetical protein